MLFAATGHDRKVAHAFTQKMGFALKIADLSSGPLVIEKQHPLRAGSDEHFFDGGV